MRILHLNEYSSRVGGAEAYIASVTTALRGLGHESHLVSFIDDGPSEIAEETTYASLPDWPGSINATVTIIDRVIADFKPDVAFLHTVYHPSLISWIAERLPTVAYIHGPYPTCPGSSQYLRRHSRVCPHTAGLVCLVNAQWEKCCWGRNPSKHLRLLQRVRAFQSAYVHVKVMFVGSQFMHKLLQSARTPTSKLRILAPVLIDPVPPASPASEDSYTVLYAGRLTPEKGLRQLIEALATVPTYWQLNVAGDGPEREPCRALVNQLKLADRVHFAGWQNENEMSMHLRQCALVAVPSLWPEPFGRVGPEAFIHGRPVVAYATGGIPDWLDDGMTGYLVTAGDKHTLGRCIQALLESPDLRREMGLRAQQHAMTAWSTQVHLRQLLDAFDEAMTGTPGEMLSMAE